MPKSELDRPAKAFVVGLAGPSGTGKSTVARQIAFRLNGHAISMETYSTYDPTLSFEERSRLNYDEPSAIDLPLLDGHIRRYAAGFPIESPVYDFGHHLRLDRTIHVEPKPLLIVEGILALHFAELRPHYQLSICLEAPDETCYRRRQVRDITERQRTLDLIRWQYETTVLPAARKYCRRASATPTSSSTPLPL